ncbi:MAG: ABC transporter ATP-binding protein [Anaerolineales bacterium]|nr:ABC transporter ATP-binding protein [Anaerolineales bacterium]
MFGLKQQQKKINGMNGHDKSVNLVELRQVVKSYHTPAGDFIALNGVDLDVPSGGFLSIIGKSGSGKSTLINMVTGIDRPTAGEVVIANVPVHRLNEEQIAIWRGMSVGVIFQFFQLLPTLTAVENVMLAMDYGDKYPRSERPERALQLLEHMDVAQYAHELPAALSGGEQQRVAIARSLANDPVIIAADEPTGNLDSKSTERVIMLFEELADDGKTILMVTHDNDLARRALRTLVLADGEIVAERDNKA